MFEDQVVIKIKKKQGKLWDVRDHQKPKVLALFRLFDHIWSYLHILHFYTLLGHLALQHGQPKLRASGGVVESDGAASDLSASEYVKANSGDVTTVTTLGNSALGLVAEWLLQSSARPSCGSFLWGHAAAGGNLGTLWGDFADWLILETMEKTLIVRNTCDYFATTKVMKIVAKQSNCDYIQYI